MSGNVFNNIYLLGSEYDTLEPIESNVLVQRILKYIKNKTPCLTRYLTTFIATAYIIFQTTDYR